MHLLSTRQINSPSQLDNLFSLANKAHDLKLDSRSRVLAIVKDEASTRTRVSFEVAMKRLGGDVVNVQLDHNTSIAKGETIEDTIQTLGQYVDAIVMRHSVKGMVAQCANHSPVPVINAGDGDGEHPTQALLDSYTIFRELGRLNNLNIMMVGDLKCSRTVHSLIHLLCLYPHNTFTFVSPENLKIPSEYLPQQHECREESELSEALAKDGKKVDVLYMTRFQKERYLSVEEVLEIDWTKQSSMLIGKHEIPAYYQLTKVDIANLNLDCRVMHPLPRREEIPTFFDSDPRATYFRQVKNGMYVRMVLLYNLFTKGDYFARQDMMFRV